jgi:hypothetical protein
MGYFGKKPNKDAIVTWLNKQCQICKDKGFFIDADMFTAVLEYIEGIRNSEVVKSNQEVEYNAGQDYEYGE